MIFKFPNPINLLKELLKSFNGCYNALYIPNSEHEKFCYVFLTKTQIGTFLKHFGGNGGCVLADNSPEYPGSERSTINHRIDKFILLMHR
jgi:hypothetical protein